MGDTRNFTERGSLFAVERLRGFLPPKGMTSIAAEPTKPAEAKALHQSLDALERVVEAARAFLASEESEGHVRWGDKKRPLEEALEALNV